MSETTIYDPEELTTASLLKRIKELEETEANTNKVASKAFILAEELEEKLLELEQKMEVIQQ